jgi:hypothetical protein
MERQDEIRKALNSFLHIPRRPEPIAAVDSATVFSPARAVSSRGARLRLSDAQRAVLHDLQDSLRQNGIDAELEEIGRGILEALAARPSLCRGLLAAYFLDV